MVPGVARAVVVTVTASDWAGLAATHPLPAITLIVPLATLQLEKSTVMEVVPWPEVIIALAGTVHVYEVAPCTAAILYITAVVPLGTEARPDIAPGCAIARELKAKDKLTGEALMQALLAVTTIVPFTALQE
jgi:hypothetical protein